MKKKNIAISIPILWVLVFIFLTINAQVFGNYIDDSSIINDIMLLFIMPSVFCFIYWLANSIEIKF